jgi:hypothetical protein
MLGGQTGTGEEKGTLDWKGKGNETENGKGKWKGKRMKHGKGNSIVKQTTAGDATSHAVVLQLQKYLYEPDINMEG